MFLAMLFVLVSSYALGMDKQPNRLQIQDEKTPLLDNNWVSAKDTLGGLVYLALEKIKKTPAIKFDTLENKIPGKILTTVLRLFTEPFTLEQWEQLDENNITEQIVAHASANSSNYFKYQQYNLCLCKSPDHKLQSNDAQRVTYLKDRVGIVMAGTQTTSFRAELLPFDAESDVTSVESDVTSKHEIYIMQRDTTGSRSRIFVGPYIATLEYSFKSEYDSITIANDPNSEKIIAVIVTEWNDTDKMFSYNKSTGETLYRMQERVFHYVAKPTEKKLTQVLLDKVGDTIQSINREALLKNSFQPSKIIENQIKSYDEVQQLIPKLIPKKPEKQKNCVMQ